ncbi:hypothetical protein [Saccharolobus islandicus]|uniref:Uncharacterized protein n=1 Tax=Saccharolobus islandicus (strain M.14.25 / Kamchatka \|nr:hypothetical protein [Sulfolobus islandicus]ACP37429.1 hypothetical protein M1425_0602 [Sulfolobus islandicus M.14.25]
MSNSPFFLDYLEDGLVDWNRALDAKELIKNKYEKLLKEGLISKEELERYEYRKIYDLQQATEKISKGLLLIYAGIILLPFLIVAEIRNFDVRHPREMQEILNSAEKFIRKSIDLNDIEKLGHEPVKVSNLKELLELTQHSYRRYLGITDLAKCLKSIENFITSSLKNKKWKTLWEIVKTCEKSFNFSQFSQEVLQFLKRCISGDEEACKKLNLSDEKLSNLLENPYIIRFSLIMAESSIKEFLDMILLTSYLEPLSTASRYSISIDNATRELLEDVKENQDNIMSFLEVKIQIIKNLIKNDEFMENISKIYEIFRKLYQL